MILTNIWLFIIFFCLLFFSYSVISSNNTITSILCLIFVYVLVAILYLILGAEFLAILLIIVYVGAISILFLFVVMLLNLSIFENSNIVVDYFPIIFLIFFFFSLIIFNFNQNTILHGSSPVEPPLVDFLHALPESHNLLVLSWVLFNYCPFYLLFTGDLLIFALIGCICITVNLEYRNLIVSSLGSLSFNNHFI